LPWNKDDVFVADNALLPSAIRNSVIAQNLPVERNGDANTNSTSLKRMRSTRKRINYLKRSGETPIQAIGVITVCSTQPMLSPIAWHKESVTKNDEANSQNLGMILCLQICTR
jgi:hypothetical protein